jgi:hypothetical protein
MNQFNGLPAHILLIHMVVLGIPVAALVTVLSAVWPSARRRLGIATPIIALLALVCVPITTNAGEWLQDRVYRGYSNPLIVRHAELGDELLPWAIGLFVLAVIAWGLPLVISRAKGPAVLGSDGVRIAVGVLTVAVAVIAIVQVYRIGDSGAKAAWSSNFCAQPYVGDTCPAT